MAGTVAVITKIMPESPDTNLDEIEEKAKKVMEEQGGMNISYSREPIAFGLNAIMLKMAWPEEKDTEIIETKLAEIEHVSSAQITDYRRAFG